jgi:argininosuccinate lyase
MVREKKIPFRTAHKIVGRVVNVAIDENIATENIDSDFIDNVSSELGFEELKLDNELIHKALDPLENVKMRKVPGGPSPEMVQLACDNMKKFLKEEFYKKDLINDS